MTTSIGEIEWARKPSIGPLGSDRTLKLSYVPRTSTVGVTPDAGSALVMPTLVASESSAVAANSVSRFKAPPFDVRTLRGRSSLDLVLESIRRSPYARTDANVV